MCRLCTNEVGTVQHILSGCNNALEQGRYTWRHDKVLNQIQNQVAYHLYNLVNNPKRPVSTQERDTPFVRAGSKGNEMPIKRQHRAGMGILTAARDWVLLADVKE